jgi:hypothetical protein
MRYSEVYKGMGYTVEVIVDESGRFGWSAQVDGEMDTATHVNMLASREKALEAGRVWAKGAIEKNSKRR